jgi:lipid II:glycine glycyltransferase (peptidoglycan interpeptide bridge formation enzyme)
MNNIVAGTTIFQTKNVIHVQYIGSNNNKNILGSLDFLFYNLINDTFSDYKFFDFGTSNENEGRKVNSGLLYWKEGFGARSISQNFYEINTGDFKKLNNLMI